MTMGESLLDTWGKKVPVIDGNNQMKESSASSTTIIIQNVLDREQMKFTASLLQHMNLLYSQMLGSEVADMIDNSPMQQTRSWYNPGHSSVTESA